MTHRILFTSLGLLLLAGAIVSCQQPGHAPASVGDNAEDALRKADLAWAESARKKDLDRVLSFMAEGGETLAPNEPLASDPAAIRASWQGLLGLPDVQLSWQPVRVEVAASGELGYTRGTYTLSFTGPDGKPVRDEGKYCEVWKRVGGQWKCLIDSYSSNLPVK